VQTKEDIGCLALAAVANLLVICLIFTDHVFITRRRLATL